MQTKLVGEIAGNYSTVVLMFGFAIVAMAPALLISRMISPRKKSNPVKFLPMECGQVPSGEGRTHFMMQYYPYILMFVIFDVVAIFSICLGQCTFGTSKKCNFTYDGILGNHVWCNVICTLSIRETKNMVVIYRNNFNEGWE